ncbi:MAG: membrane dipeptidase [Bryobacteraceae bacterium]|nr:membrane dipeptidase [Bryobacteraceae bacterium]
MTRRDFVALGAAFGPQSPPSVAGMYEQALVFDALSVSGEWDEAAREVWKRSGYTAIHTSLSNRNFRVAVRDLARWREIFAARESWLTPCLRASDVARAKREGKLGVMLGFQNGTVVDDDVENLRRLHASGARSIQLTYNSRNLLGDGCTERTNAGLSDFGVECVERMNQLGIVVDLSHCGEQTSADGIAFSRKPPAFTHTMCKAVYDHVRAKSDKLLQALSEKGGVTGIAALGYFVGPTAEASLEDYLRHIDHAVKVCGIDHVGLATDFSIRGIEATETRESWYVPRTQIFKPSYRVRWPPWIPELDKPERFRTVAEALARRGYPAADIEKILGGNWVRYFQDVFGG